MTVNSSAIPNFNFTIEIISAEDAKQKGITFFDSPWKDGVTNSIDFAYGLQISAVAIAISALSLF